MANKIQVRRGTEAQLAASGPLAAGEPGYTTDTKELVIGNGTGANTPLVSATSADITYYVRTDGSDSNTGLANTAGAAFKTIAKAISMIPQIINHTVTINVAAGAYTEAVIITGFTGSGRLELSGDTVVSATRTITSLVVTNNSASIYIKGIRALNTAGAGFYGASNTNLGIEACSIIASASSQPGFDFGGGGMVSLNGCLASNRNAALNVNGAVIVVSYTWQAGSGNAYGISVYFGKVGKAGTQPSGTTAEYVAAGGEIGTQGVINPWGDNTPLQRPHARTAMPTDQVISANTWTKMAFTTEITDFLGNYDPTNRRFTAPVQGVYAVSAFTVFTTGGLINEVYLFANGVGLRQMDYRYQTSYSTGCGGVAFVHLGAGDYLEIFAKSSGANTLSKDFSYFEVVRVA